MTYSSPALLLSACALVLQGCSTTPAYVRPEVQTPAQWQDASALQGATAPSSAPTPDWWIRFGSEELNSLMAQAVAANQELAAALSRIDQARASARVARSRLAPSVDAEVSGGRQVDKLNGKYVSSNFDQASLSVAYEVDLWGANASSVRGANARVAATEYDRDALRLLIQSEVASTYLQALALRERLQISRQNLDAARQVLALVEVRFGNGAVTGLDVAQQRTSVLTQEAELPSLEQSASEALSALAVLLGRAPQQFEISGQSLTDIVIPTIDAGLPSALLERRPDIRAAEASLMAAHADVASARAALFPTLNLSVSAIAANALSGGTTSVGSLAAALAQNIFDGGNLRGQVELSAASRQELVAVYAQTVLTSLQEVEDSLTAVSRQKSRADLLAAATEEARRAYDLARVRFDAGSEDLLTLLDTQRSLLSTQGDRVQAEYLHLAAKVGLFKALGGGWSG